MIINPYMFRTGGGIGEQIAERFIDFNIINGYTLGYTEQSIYTYCIQIEGILEKLDLMYLSSHNAQFGSVNLVDPEKYRATLIGNLAWSSEGVKWDEVPPAIEETYIVTNFSPNLLVTDQKYLLNDASRGAIVTLNYEMGNWYDWILDGNMINSANSMYANDGRPKQVNTQYDNSNANFLGTGLKVVSRNGSTVSRINKDISTSTTSSATMLYGNQVILRHGNTWRSRMRICLYFMGGSLTFAETQILRTAFDELRQSNGLTQIA